ncbi:Protein kinase domain-containing protein [Meloidogyne graminicola]|uniref:Protein kinase domain-containing protein n=1 Tax=Meloidogyne graminicola TaxID=189291 RepID=A0A8S9ZDC6_9BILA|nr:Protein kinase domain-containing protein [Meloidogyne graminicola]
MGNVKAKMSNAQDSSEYSAQVSEDLVNFSISSLQIKSSTSSSTNSEENSKIVEISKGELVGDYKVMKRLGSGGCGVVYQVMANGINYAMKIERKDLDKTDQLLGIEAHVLKRLQFSPFTVPFIQYGTCQNKGIGLRALIMGLLGPSIDVLRGKQIKGRFSIRTVLMIGIQALQAVSFVHFTYFVHRDIKPSNFAIGQTNFKRIYLFDFGLSRSIKKRGEMSLRTMRENVSFRGTSNYCSLNVHNRKEHGRHDDLWLVNLLYANRISNG